VDILDDMGVSKLLAKVFFKVNYSCKNIIMILPIKIYCSALTNTYTVNGMKSFKEHMEANRTFRFTFVFLKGYPEC